MIASFGPDSGVWGEHSCLHPRAGTLEPPKGTNLVRTYVIAALVHKSEITRGRNAARSALRTARTSITS
jgi:hypothetical protein